MTCRILVIYCTILALVCTVIPLDGYAAGLESRAYINSSCIIADEPYLLPETEGESNARMAPILGALAIKLGNVLISGIINGTASGLSRRGARKDTEYVTANNVNLFAADLTAAPVVTLNPQFGCATIVTGDIQPSDYDCTNEYVPRAISAGYLSLPQSEWVTSRTDNSVENILKRANVCVVGQVRSVFEARVVLSDDRTAYRVDSAGYTINYLLDTKSKSAKRNLFYTMEVVEPSADGDGRVLTMSLINLGEVSAGASSLGDMALSSDWLLVPQISSFAQQDFMSDTTVHREVYGKIEALERVVARDSRYLAGIEERASTAEPEIRAALQNEMTSVQIRLVTSGSMLDALRGEYQDLPAIDAQYMPVTIRFGITETRSESKAMQQIAEAIEANSEMLATSAAKLAGVSRSLDDDIGGNGLDGLRAEYFDALVALDIESPESGVDIAQLQNNLETAKRSYNEALVAAGLPSID
jgi:hypothetical protein